MFQALYLNMWVLPFSIPLVAVNVLAKVNASRSPTKESHEEDE